MKSINQLAQEEGDSSRNEANRIRERESAIRSAWRQIAFNTNRRPAAKEIAEQTSLPENYVRVVCERNGDLLQEDAQ
jgi:hypothetical protein